MSNNYEEFKTYLKKIGSGELQEKVLLAKKLNPLSS